MRPHGVRGFGARRIVPDFPAGKAVEPCRTGIFQLYYITGFCESIHFFGEGERRSTKRNNRSRAAKPFAAARRETKKTSNTACLDCMSSSSKSDRAFNLIGTEASCTDIDMAGGTVNDRLHTLDVRLPRPISTPMGMGNLNTESNTLTANIALCQLLHLQS